MKILPTKFIEDTDKSMSPNVKIASSGKHNKHPGAYGVCF